MDGLVYVHHYTDRQPEALRDWTRQLNETATGFLGADDARYFGRDPDFERLRLRGYQELVALFAGST